VDRRLGSATGRHAGQRAHAGPDGDTIAAVSRVLDARTVVVGMRPAVAITLVELGLSLPGIETALDVERGMAKIAATAGRTGSSSLDDGSADDES
jgi:rsbT antagonist protein RsbS